MRNDNYFVSQPQQMLRKGPNVHFDTAQSWIKEITDHGNAVTSLWSRRHRRHVGNIVCSFLFTCN
jgi:hypothetical protein